MLASIDYCYLLLPRSLYYIAHMQVKGHGKHFCTEAHWRKYILTKNLHYRATFVLTKFFPVDHYTVLYRVVRDDQMTDRLQFNYTMGPHQLNYTQNEIIYTSVISSNMVCWATMSFVANIYGCDHHQEFISPGAAYEYLLLSRYTCM